MTSSAASQHILDSPEATTTAILGASSSGWSPLRVSKSSTMPNSQSGIDDAAPSAVRAQEIERRSAAAISTLKSHSLVSNSPFKQQGSPTKYGRSPGSDSDDAGTPGSDVHGFDTGSAALRRGFGLGIGVEHVPTAASRMPRTNSGFTPRKLSDEQRIKSTGSLVTGHSHYASGTNQENMDPGSHKVEAVYQPPRKSQGFKALQSASCVSNSPFKASGSAPVEVKDQPLVPKNAWATMASLSPKKESRGVMQAGGSGSANSSPTRGTAASGGRGTPNKYSGLAAIAAAANARPSTPENYAPSSLPTTPTSTPRRRNYHAGQGGAVNTSPTGKGLLVSNRMHGPRSPPGNESLNGTPDRSERRKTVTFDEMLDVQEFDKESSFDEESNLDPRDRIGVIGSGESSSTIDSNASSAAVSEQSDDASLPDVMVGEDGLPLSVQQQKRISEDGSPEEIQQHTFGASRVLNGAAELRVINPDVSDDGDEQQQDSASTASQYTSNDSPALTGTPALTDDELASDTADGEETGDSSDSSRDYTAPSTADSEEGHSPVQRFANVKQPANHGPPLMSAIVTDEQSFAESFHESFNILQGLRDQPDVSMRDTDAVARLKELHRVDSMVDELLQQEMLFGAGQKKSTPVSQRPLPTPPPAGTDANTPTRQGSLSRPRISRNTVLERVAREKQHSASPDVTTERISPDLEEQEATPSAVRHSSTEGHIGGGTPTAVRLDRTRKGSDPIVGTPTKRSTPMSAELSAADMYTEAADAYAAERPAKDQAQSEKQDGVTHTAPVPRPEPVRRESLPRSPLERVGDFAASSGQEGPGLHLAAPAAADSSFDSMSNGRLSPSLLGPEPPKVSLAQHADHIIARRRSKNGKPPPRRRSMSTGDANQHTQAQAEDNKDIDAVITSTQGMVDQTINAAVDGGFGNGIEREISRIYRNADVSRMRSRSEPKYTVLTSFTLCRKSTTSMTEASSRASKTRSRTTVKRVTLTVAKLGASCADRVTW